MFRALVDDHGAGLRRYASRIVRSHDVAEDVVQEVFLGVWRAWDRVQVGPGMRAYLYSATRTHALTYLRRARREERRQEEVPRDEAAGEPSAPGEGEARVEGEAIVGAIERVLAQMPPRQGEVARLRLRGQLTTREIADRLAISPRTVELHMGRATKLLRARLPSLLAGHGLVEVDSDA